MPRSALAALAVTVLVPAALAAPAGARSRPRCNNARGDTILQSGNLRVFSTSTPSRTDPDAATLRVFACAPRSRRIRRLETFKNNLDGSLTPAGAVRGGSRWLVLDLREETGTSDGRDLFEYDLKTSKRVARAATDDFQSTPLVATSGGGFALLSPPLLGGGGGKLTAFDSGGGRVLQAAGASALAAAGNTVYWTAGGVVGSATLTGRPNGDVKFP